MLLKRSELPKLLTRGHQTGRTFYGDVDPKIWRIFNEKSSFGSVWYPLWVLCTCVSVNHIVYCSGGLCIWCLGFESRDFIKLFILWISPLSHCNNENHHYYSKLNVPSSDITQRERHFVYEGKHLHKIHYTHQRCRFLYKPNPSFFLCTGRPQWLWGGSDFYVSFLSVNSFLWPWRPKLQVNSVQSYSWLVCFLLSAENVRSTVVVNIGIVTVRHATMYSCCCSNSLEIVIRSKWDYSLWSLRSSQSVPSLSSSVERCMRISVTVNWRRSLNRQI